MQPPYLVQQEPAPIQLGALPAIHWPTFAARVAVRGLIAWPLISLLGGTGWIRGALTGVAVGAAYTTAELAYDAAHTLGTQVLEQQTAQGLTR